MSEQSRHGKREAPPERTSLREYWEQHKDWVAGLSRGSLFSEGGGVGIAALCAAGGLAVGMVLMWAIQRARAKGQA